ncbi:putative zinc finger domain-containing protein [Encephalitozoon intestinalis ATCC 50506]|uniref:Zinc finger domain-containing protein n=1 Tax=Encephalitozoon intestinalis (strain ATCC 50506) TaxID=876142 RepID=E0S9T6_ENCIT|nr:putative zinc finger domain-containing protein [Encephalitozoon intestinalis ATCC 50506]ADM12471.1 putative zinc finger domain-containing protein [Encephalitozoon intestinalis ATCC 50506]UTX46308.1 zinc finger domain-containing protein [Encephalitozoon intestinalis]
MLPKLNVPTRLNKSYLLEYRVHKIVPKTTPKPREVERSASNYRTILCKFFLMNSCKHGDNCTYSHDTSKFPCKAFHIKGNCTRKDCPFSHEPPTDKEMEEIISEKQEESTSFFKSTLL